MSRTYTHEQVVQIIEEMIGHHPHLSIANVTKHSPAMSWDKALREVLRRLEALPTPPAAPERLTPCDACAERSRAVGLSVCETCARGIYGRHRTRAATPTPEGPAQEEGCDCRRRNVACIHVVTRARRLREERALLVPQSEPTAPPHCAPSSTRAPVPAVRTVTPTPVPEGPALTWCDGEHDWDGRGADLPSDGRMEVRCSRCPAVARRMASMDLTPEPTEPEVVWEDEWVRVAGPPREERPEVRIHGEWTRYNDQHIITLGRALAEAKRELAILKASAEGHLKTTNAAERSNAELAWGVAGSMQSALRRERSLRQEAERELRCDHGQPKEYCAQSFNDAVDAAKARGAESMRDRALAQAHTLATSHINPKVRDACASLAREIGALPLEET